MYEPFREGERNTKQQKQMQKSKTSMNDKLEVIKKNRE